MLIKKLNTFTEREKKTPVDLTELDIDQLQKLRGADPFQKRH